MAKLNREQIQKFIKNNLPHDEIRLINGMDDAFIGICERIGMIPVAAYDTRKCIEILEEDMDYEGAVEYFDFNIMGAWEGEGTAVFITSVNEKRGDSYE